jgi:hypothetical protein
LKGSISSDRERQGIDKDFDRWTRLKKEGALFGKVCYWPVESLGMLVSGNYEVISNTINRINEIKKKKKKDPKTQAPP